MTQTNSLAVRTIRILLSAESTILTIFVSLAYNYDSKLGVITL